MPTPDPRTPQPPRPDHSPRPGHRIGELLIEHRVLTEAQVRQILDQQAKRSHPFGQLAAEMFGLAEEELWRAWAVQMRPFLGRLDPDDTADDAEALSLIAGASARRWSVLPLRLENDTLLCATTEAGLPEAMARLQVRGACPVRFVLADPEDLERRLARAYPVADRTAIA